MEVVFVLVKPAVPENIGAAARAIKTMGFADLRLVETNAHMEDPAHWLAHGAGDILKSAKVYDRYEDAVEDIDFTIATTAKKRMAKGDYLPVNELPSFLNKKFNTIQSIALVFGSEESGLSNEIIRQCDAASSISMKTTFPSLNLAQAVMVYAWELSGKLSIEKVSSGELDKASYTVFKDKLIALLEETGINKNLNLYHRILERSAHLSGDDINLILSVLQKLR